MAKKKIVFIAMLLAFVILADNSLHLFSVSANNDDEEEIIGEETEQESEEAASPEEDYKDELTALNDKIKKLADEKKIIQNNINQAKSDKEKEIAKKNLIDSQISLTREEISLLLERIAVLESEIENKEEEIAQKQEEYAENYALYLKRLKNMQLNSEATTLSAVLGSANYADYLSTNRMMSRIAEYDQQLMENINNEREALERDKEELLAIKELVEEDKKSTESKKSELDGQLKDAQIRIQDMDELERQFMSALEANQAQEKQVQAELEEIYRRIEWDSNPYVGGEMLWPINGYYNISSPYGWRFSGKDFHTGMDIAGPGIYGKPILAANDGTVKVVNTSYRQGVGYGIYLIIDHGGGMSTLYGHTSEIVVSVGQQVKKGDVVAKVGSTGWSTGPHLHFEVRVDGVHKNPIGYVKG